MIIAHHMTLTHIFFRHKKMLPCCLMVFKTKLISVICYLQTFITRSVNFIKIETTQSDHNKILQSQSAHKKVLKTTEITDNETAFLLVAICQKVLG